MTDLSRWIGVNVSPIDETSRAASAWIVIQRNPISITIKRGSTKLEPQTVRVEYASSNREVTGEADASSSRVDVVVFGIRNHTTEPDTDIRRDDVFALEVEPGLFIRHRVEHVNHFPGSVQAMARAMS